MGLLNRLQSIADKLGLITVVAEAPDGDPDPDRVTTRSVSLGELAASVQSEEVRRLAELPAEMSVSFEKVYEAAGLTPPEHGWTIERLSQLLKTAQYRSLAREAAQQAVLGVLSADKVEVKDLVEDAVSRDKALDAYAEYVRKKVDERISARRRKIEELKEEIRSLKQQGSELLEQSEADEEQWKSWRASKREAEDGLAWALGYLLDEPLITRDED